MSTWQRPLGAGGMVTCGMWAPRRRRCWRREPEAGPWLPPAGAPASCPKDGQDHGDSQRPCSVSSRWHLGSGLGAPFTCRSFPCAPHTPARPALQSLPDPVPHTAGGDPGQVTQVLRASTSSSTEWACSSLPCPRCSPGSSTPHAGRKEDLCPRTGRQDVVCSGDSD